MGKQEKPKQDKPEKPKPAFFVVRTEILALLLGIILVAAALLYLYLAAPATPTPAAQSDQLRTLMLSSIEKQISADNYSYASELYDAGSNATAITNVFKQGKEWRFDQISADAEVSTYFSPDKVIVCTKLSAKGEWLCADSAAVPALATLAGEAGKNFASSADLDKAKLLLDNGAIIPVGNISNKIVLGRECTQAAYVTDYKKLSIDELGQIGLTSDSPAVKDVTNLESTNCYDSETGFILESSTSFSYKSVNSSSTRTFTSFSDSVPADAFALPAKLLTPDEYANLSDIEQKKDDCMKKFNDTSDIDQCLKTQAYNTRDPVFCAQMGDNDTHERELCYFMLMQQTKDPSFCASAGSIADDCYFEAAKSFNLTSACASIQNETLKANCTS